MAELGNRKDKKRQYGSFLHAAIALCLIIYLIFAISLSAKISRQRVCNGIKIDVSDTTSFLKPADIIYELGSLADNAKGRKILEVDTDSIETFLNSIDKIETASVVRLSDGYILITVVPMQPVMRVFDGKESYYVNREGKRIAAQAKYHIDLPIVQGDFTEMDFDPIKLLPLVQFIESDSLWKHVVSSIKLDHTGDIILIPNFTAHVINFGTPDNIANKFSRLHRMYLDVIPYKGWENYDTISLKWNSQVVATKRNKKRPVSLQVIEEDEEGDDLETMMAEEGVAPGQSLPGKKAKVEKNIPAAKNNNNNT